MQDATPVVFKMPPAPSHFAEHMDVRALSVELCEKLTRFFLCHRSGW